MVLSLLVPISLFLSQGVCHAQTPIPSPSPVPTAVFYVSYYFNAYDAGGEEWETNPAYMVDNNTSNYAKSLTDNKVELLTGNTCAGTNLGTISAVEIRAYGIVDNPLSKVNFRPVFSGSSDGDDHQSSIYSSNDWSSRMNVTVDTNAPAPWTWTDVQNLDCDVIYKPHSASGSVSKVEIRMTYNQPSPTVTPTPSVTPTPTVTPTMTPTPTVTPSPSPSPSPAGNNMMRMRHSFIYEPTTIKYSMLF